MRIKGLQQETMHLQAMRAVLSVEEAAGIHKAAPGPGLSYRAVFSVAYGGGLRASEVTHLKAGDIVPEARLGHDAGSAPPARQ
ncbi:hypothetical protein [Leisingera sp. M527]|uniref:hypothetical protein n=1 Tax=Leisingera sp. M527 TaxID=2867014 RepID=UPI0028834BD3|nr:hypothetical protein [Leisingera sp. M527]